MGKGKASGIDRDYQVLARRIVETLRYDKGLIPYSGYGIDVPIEMGGSTWAFDFALTTSDGNNIIVGECKRWAFNQADSHCRLRVSGRAIAEADWARVWRQCISRKQTIKLGR